MDDSIIQDFFPKHTNQSRHINDQYEELTCLNGVDQGSTNIFLKGQVLLLAEAFRMKLIGINFPFSFGVLIPPKYSLELSIDSDLSII